MDENVPDISGHIKTKNKFYLGLVVPFAIHLPTIWICLPISLICIKLQTLFSKKKYHKFVFSSVASQC